MPPCGKRAFSPDAFAIMIVAHRKGLPTLAWWTCHHEKKRVFSPRGEHLVSRAPASFLSRLGLQDPRHRGLLTEVAPRLLTILQHWPDIPPVDKSTPIVRLVAFTDVSAQLGGSWLQVFVAAGWAIFSSCEPRRTVPSSAMTVKSLSWRSFRRLNKKFS